MPGSFASSVLDIELRLREVLNQTAAWPPSRRRTQASLDALRDLSLLPSHPFSTCLPLLAAEVANACWADPRADPERLSSSATAAAVVAEMGAGKAGSPSRGSPVRGSPVRGSPTRLATGSGDGGGGIDRVSSTLDRERFYGRRLYFELIDDLKAEVRTDPPPHTSHD